MNEILIDWTRPKIDVTSAYSVTVTPAVAGRDGADGADGEGVPVGGEADEVLVKIDGQDYNTEWRANTGDGDMTKAVYDPTTVESDVFAMVNMAEGANALILTDAERTEIGKVSPHIADESDPHGATPANELLRIVSRDGEGVSTFSGIALDTGAAPLDAIGLIRWNDADKCAEVVSEGATIQLGQEVGVFCRNTSGATLPEGAPVYVSGAQGNKPLVELADASSETTSRVIGLVTSDGGIANNGNGFVTSFGLVRGLNTNAYLEGDRLYLSETPGQLTTIAPTSESAYIVSIGGVVTAAVSQGEIAVNVDLSGTVIHYRLANATSEQDARIAIGAAGQADLDTHTGNASIHFADAISDGQTYGRNNGAWSIIDAGGGGDVTAAANIADNAIVKGDGGAKGVQSSGVTIDSSDAVMIFPNASGSTITSNGGGASGKLYLIDVAASLRGPVDDDSVNVLDGQVELITNNIARLTVTDTAITAVLDITVPDEAYGLGWDESLEVPTKNAVYDKIETLSAGGDVTGPASATDNGFTLFDGTTGKVIKDSSITYVVGTGGIGTTGTLQSTVETRLSIASPDGDAKIRIENDLLDFYTRNARKFSIDQNNAEFFTAVLVQENAYDPSWNGNREAATKNAIYDKIESITDALIDDEFGNMNIAIDGGGDVVATGERSYTWVAPRNGTLSDWDTRGDGTESGSANWDIKKNGISVIGGGVAPGIISNTDAQGSNLESWTTGFVKGDLFKFNPSSVATFTYLQLSLNWKTA